MFAKELLESVTEHLEARRVLADLQIVDLDVLPEFWQAAPESPHDFPILGFGG